MKALRWLGIVMVLISLSLQGVAQSILDSGIHISPGNYTAEEIITLIANKGINISYSQSSLLQQSINITAHEHTVKNLLKLLFDLKKYKYLIRETKVLIVPRHKRNTGLSEPIEEQPMLAETWQIFIPTSRAVIQKKFQIRCDTLFTSCV